MWCLLACFHSAEQRPVSAGGEPRLEVRAGDGHGRTLGAAKSSLQPSVPPRPGWKPASRCEAGFIPASPSSLFSPGTYLEPGAEKFGQIMIQSLGQWAAKVSGQYQVGYLSAKPDYCG